MDISNLKKPRWTVESDTFLRAYYRAEGGPYCAVKLNRTPEAVKCRARELGLSRTKKQAQNERFARKRILAALPSRMMANPAVTDSDFIRPLTREQLMRGKA